MTDPREPRSGRARLRPLTRPAQTGELAQLQREMADYIVEQFKGGAPGLAPRVAAHSRVIDVVMSRMMTERHTNMDAAALLSGRMMGASDIRQSVVRSLAEALSSQMNKEQLQQPGMGDGLALFVAKSLPAALEESVMNMVRGRTEMIDGKPVHIANLFGVLTVSKFLEEFGGKLNGIGQGITGARISTPDEIRRSLQEAAKADPGKFMQTQLADLIRDHIKVEFPPGTQPDKTLADQARARMLAAYTPGAKPSDEAALAFYLKTTGQDPLQDSNITRANFLAAVQQKYGAIPSGFLDNNLARFASSIQNLSEDAQAQRTLDHVRGQFGAGALPASITAAELMRLQNMSEAQRAAHVKAKAGTVTLRDGTPIPWAALEAFERGDKMPMARALGIIRPAGTTWQDGKPVEFYKHRSEEQVRREIEASPAMRTVRMYQGLENNPVVTAFRETGERLQAMRDYGGRATLAEMDRLSGGKSQDRNISEDIRTRMLAEINAGVNRSIPDAAERAAAQNAFASMDLRSLGALTPRVIATRLRDEMLENQIDRNIAADHARGEQTGVAPARRTEGTGGPRPQ